jgi:hypothetical protein
MPPWVPFTGLSNLCVKVFRNLGWGVGFRVTEPVVEIGSTH